MRHLSKPDLDVQSFSNNEGMWSFEAEEAFRKRLEQLKLQMENIKAIKHGKNPSWSIKCPRAF